jgi:squalene-hopene/tetraprenyl-beta-curcumene cyclase
MRFKLVCLVGLIALIRVASVVADDPLNVDAALHQKTVRAGLDFLVQGQSREDGSFSKHLGPAVTAMCAYAMMQNGVSPERPEVSTALVYVESFVQPDGGIYPEGSNLRNYETSIAVMCFQLANKNGKYDDKIAKAVTFLKSLQWDDAEGHPLSSNFFGGQGYGSGKRPDASNTSFYLDALNAVGEDANSTAVRNATIFMSRCQNLPSAHNTLGYAAVVTAEDKGGFIYSAAGEGESKAGKTPEGGLRSYASMTYAGLKSFLHAGLNKDDIRVQAALDWIRRNYDLKSNPGMGEQGLFYYYHVFAKALSTLNERQFVDASGKAHNWRAELTAELASRQKTDGSWVNATDRWYEGDPNLVTCYALMALSYCDPKYDK